MQAEARVGDKAEVAIEEPVAPPAVLPRPVKAPSNLVTSWGGAPAKRVIAGTQKAAGFPLCDLGQPGLFIADGMCIYRHSKCGNSIGTLLWQM